MSTIQRQVRQANDGGASQKRNPLLRLHTCLPWAPDNLECESGGPRVPRARGRMSGHLSFDYRDAVAKQKSYDDFCHLSLCAKPYLLFSCHNAKGVLHTRPPTKPTAATGNSGEPDDAPKATPKTGISSVRYATANNMTRLDLVASATTTTIRAGVTKATPNSHKSSIWSVVKASCTRMNDKPVTNPVRPPTSQTLISLPILVDSTYRAHGSLLRSEIPYGPIIHSPSLSSRLSPAQGSSPTRHRAPLELRRSHVGGRVDCGDSLRVG